MPGFGVSMYTDNQTNRREGRIFIELADPFHEICLRGMRLFMLCTDHYSRYKFLRFLRKKFDAMEGLKGIINDDIAPQGLQNDIIRADGEGEFSGQFQTFLNERGIKREKPPPPTPQ